MRETDTPSLAALAEQTPAPADLTERRLTKAQERVYLQELRCPATSINNNSCVIELDGDVDRAAMEAALKHVVGQHPSLWMQMTRMGAVPIYVRGACPAVDPTWADFSLSGAESNAEDVFERRFANEPFDLRASASLFRFAIMRDRSGRGRLLACFHHLISDGFSVGLVLRVVLDTYRAMVCGASVPAREEPPLQDYRSYIAHEADYLGSESHRDDAAYWRGQLANAPTRAMFEALPHVAHATDHADVSTRDVSFSLDDLRVAALARALGTPRPVALLASLSVTLSRLSGCADFVLGFPVHNRATRPFARANGVVANVVPLRVSLDATQSTPAWVGTSLRAQVRGAVRHGRCSSVEIWRGLDEGTPERGAASLFDVMFDYQVQEARSDDGVATRLVPSGAQLHPLTIKCVHYRGMARGHDLVLQYHPGRLSEAQVRTLFARWCVVIRALTQEPQRPIRELSLMLPGERERIASMSRAPPAPPPPPLRLHELVLRSLRARTAAAVLSSSDGLVSGAAVMARSGHISDQLASLPPGSVVGVCMERSSQLATAALGILRAGLVYFPIDPETPPKRVQTLVVTADARAVLTQGALLEQLRQSLPADVLVLDVLNPGEALEEGCAAPEEPSDPPAYLLFTSGTTGLPSGVLTGHRALVTQLCWMQRTFELTAEDVVLQKTSIAFDVSMWELFWPLCTQAQLSFLAPGAHRDVGLIAKHVREHGVTVLHFVPSMLRAFLHYSRDTLENIRLVICSGEALDTELAKTYRQRFPHAELYNLYGPTEASIDVTFQDCSAAALHAAGRAGARSVPIGRPVDHTRIYILDEHLGLCPMGVAGEIFIGGEGLAMGYLGQPSRTAERFFHLSSRALGRGERVYKTGDRARWLDDGSVEFLGRLDQQVKIRGFRIEVEEIEARLREHPAIVDCAVTPRKRPDGGKALAAFLVGTGAAELHQELQAWLGERLPAPMIPTWFVEVAALPETASGKTDRRALVAMPLGPPQTIDTPPRSEVELRLTATWSQVLGRPRVGVHHDFFRDLGGDSLLAIALASELELRHPEAALSIQDVYQHPTPARMALRLLAHERPSEDRPLDLEAETREVWRGIAAAHAQRTSVDVTPHSEQGEIFLTGATGFVGAYVLAELLQVCDAEICCLVRSATEESGRQRILQNLLDYGLVLTPAQRARIRVLPGDITRPRLGLTPQAYEHCTLRCSHVLHIAGRIDHHAPYERLRGANVGAVEHIVRLSLSGRPKKIVYASTEDIFSYRSGYGWEVARDEAYDIRTEQHQASTGYAGSKWVADHLFGRVMELGIDVLIFRFGIVTGDLRSGKMPGYQWIARMLHSCVSMGLRFETPPGSELDTRSFMTPVDFLAQALTRAALSAEVGSEVLHLSSPVPVSWDQVLDQVVEISGQPIEKVSIYEWLRACRERIDAGEHLPIQPFVHRELRMTPAEVDQSIAARFRGGIDIRASESLQRLEEQVGIHFPDLSEYFHAYAQFVLAGPSVQLTSTPSAR